MRLGETLVSPAETSLINVSPSLTQSHFAGPQSAHAQHSTRKRHGQKQHRMQAALERAMRTRRSWAGRAGSVPGGLQDAATHPTHRLGMAPNRLQPQPPTGKLHLRPTQKQL